MTHDINFIKRQTEGNKIRIYVAMIRWSHPHTPEISWKRVRSLPAGWSDEQVNDVIKKVLSDSRYFARCNECKTTPASLTHDIPQVAQ